MDFENVAHLKAAVQKIRAEYLRRAGGLTITKKQEETTKDVPVKGPLWVSKFEVPVSSDDSSRELFLQLINQTNERKIRYDRPSSASLQFEWIGFREDASRNTLEPLISEQEKFDKLSSETKSPLTILYVYGGTFVLNAPSTYRKIVGSLAQSTGSKVLMVRQRLAPQNPFPAALLDIFQAYLSLLSPPPGSPHKPVPSSSIVIAGDSSGTCLALSLLQVLLQLLREKAAVKFHGKIIKLSLPAGAALISVAADLTNSFPSYEKFADNDIFPLHVDKLPYLDKDYPTCPAWPTNPPRANTYCEASMLAHPLVSPAASTDWSGCCPLWLSSEQGQLADAARLIAQTANRQGVSVTLQEYEALPHTFFFAFPRAPQTRKILTDWAETIISFGKRAKRTSTAVVIHAKGLHVEAMDINYLVPYTVVEAREFMWNKTAIYKVPTWHQKERSSL